MSQQKQNNSDRSEADEIIDNLLAEQITPSKDFTARVLEEARESKVVTGPWQKTTHWMGGILTAAAAIAIAIGLSSVYSPNSSVSDFPTDLSLEANPFLEDLHDPELVDESPMNAIDSLLDNSEGLPSIDPLLEEPLLIDINILLES
ncbi:MAG: hypothetical protein ACPGN3_12240 [Opitutales bacterium]